MYLKCIHSFVYSLLPVGILCKRDSISGLAHIFAVKKTRWQPVSKLFATENEKFPLDKSSSCTFTYTHAHNQKLTEFHFVQMSLKIALDKGEHSSRQHEPTKCGMQLLKKFDWNWTNGKKSKVISSEKKPIYFVMSWSWEYPNASGK